MLRLAFHFFHHRQSAECASTDDELAAFPRYVLRDGQWRVSKVIAEFLGRTFCTLVYPRSNATTREEAVHTLRDALFETTKSTLATVARKHQPFGPKRKNSASILQ